MPQSVFDLSPKITLLPVLHGSGDFALEIRKRLLSQPYDCLAVPLPPAFEDGVEEAIDHLPIITLVAQREGSLSEDPVAYTGVPIDPCQPVIAAIRAAIANNIPRAYIDLEVANFEPRSDILPDPYALKEVPLEQFAAALLTALPKPDPEGQQTARITYMAYQLHLLELDCERICCLCAVSDWPWIRQAYQNRMPYPRPDAPVWPPDTFRVSSNTLFFILGELPFLTHLYEHRRAELLPDQTLAIDGVKALLLEARNAWIQKHDLTHHWLTPQVLSLFLKYVRNLSLMDRRLTPDLYTLALAAKQIGDDDFAVTLIETSRDYPAQRIPSDLPEIPISLDLAEFPTGEAPLKNRLLGTERVWRTLPLQPAPPPEKKQSWKMQWNPYKQCSYPPEDDKIESFNTHVREQAKLLMGEDLARTEKFTSSLKDGLDIRETLRNWHTGDLYVKEIPPSRGSLEIVVFLFESPADPDKYPWRTTWYAEHEEESTLCFYATNFSDNFIGPGIGQAVYGGCSLLFPPRTIPDIWQDPRLDFAQTLEERLLSAALFHSREKCVVLVAPHPPLNRWRRIAKRYKKRILYIPIKRFSLQTLDRLRHFHVLNGQEVRSYAAKYIRDFR
ncbi:MAG: hypothetical protein O7G87_21505 [bacterium]|nr:hypothetical protein [bacterium]